MQLINPIWLWGLTGLLIPIAIHLLSRKEGKVIKFGSLRHLEESQTKQSLNIRLNEVWLLVLRCMLISLIVLLLVELNIDLFRSQKSQWLVLEDGLEHDATIESLVDSLSQNGFEIKSMKRGFPDVSDKEAKPFGNYWDMVSHLPLESFDKVIIVSYNLASGFNGKRLPLPDNVTWISREPATKEFTLSGVKFSNDSVLTRMGKSSSLQTSFTNLTERVDQTTPDHSPLPPDTVQIAIYNDPEFEYDSKIVRAALHAIEKMVPVVFKMKNLQSSEKPPNNIDWIIWLSEKDPGVVNTNAILFRETTKNSPLLESVKASSEQWLLTKRLNEEIALKEQFALNLSDILLKKNLIQQRADSLDRTIQPEQLLWSKNKSTSFSASMRVPDNHSAQYLLFVIAALLVTERLLASKRNA